eukprot:CAMPEP_0168340936 /NCGR_PEP_ID=MMETSP0213-20121227/14366_1 /TAXON_ID=151035 /ORGANISM="Euplotes harpa, Strain FSP1.4" /LENGTH=139 /DNA_ID=CAMNT_0008347279 /DNA_START=25 /DNA_END=444 /DNA_ORIENTATION=+
MFSRTTRRFLPRLVQCKPTRSAALSRAFGSAGSFKLKVIDFLENEYEVEATEGETLLAAGLRAKVPFQKACGGNAECATCHCKLPYQVRTHQGYEDAGEKELDCLEFAPLNDEESRLACQVRLKKAVFEGQTLRFVYNE